MNRKPDEIEIALTQALDANMDAQSCRISAASALSTFPQIDLRMDEQQNAAYALIIQAETELRKTHPYQAARLRQAIRYFVQAEKFERLNEQQVKIAALSMVKQEVPQKREASIIENCLRMWRKGWSLFGWNRRTESRIPDLVNR
ncbi:MAG: hypothetical protein PHV74_00390 [Dehalococcoidia bacterium]|nr:hypothetical protein [Dehalococcoidia bacterium]